MVLIDHPKLFVAWHWPYSVWVISRYETLTACGFGPLEITFPRLGYVLPTSRERRQQQ